MRIIAFLTLIFLSTLLPWYIALVFAGIYALIWSAYELILLGVLIDAYFGVSTLIPYYTLGTIVLLVSVEWLKPRLMFYNR